ncbi:MAG: vWA domain-containing protein [Oscillospiraceae bacterium]
MRKKLLSLFLSGLMLITASVPVSVSGTETQSSDSLSEFSEEEMADFAKGFYADNKLVCGEELCSALNSLEYDSHSFKLAVNQMNIEQAGSLENIGDSVLAQAVSKAMCHSGYSSSEPVILSKKTLQAKKNAVNNSDPVWPEEGSIYLSKDAKALGEKQNMWEVTLKIKGRNYKTSSDVVLVIDCSGSMSGSRLVNTRTAAKAFGRKLLTEDSGTRIALVTYSDNAKAFNGGHFYTSDELELFSSAVDNAVYANGGTNQQAGIHLADSLLYSSSSVGVQKNIVILSDGEPTYSYPFAGGDLGLHNNLIFKQSWISDFPTIPTADYDHIIGTGGDFGLQNGNIRWTWHNLLTNHSNLYGSFYYDSNGNFVCSNGQSSSNNGEATVWEAGQTKLKGTTVYSVALQAGDNGENVLRRCASDSVKKYYAVGKNDNVETKLTTAFVSIAGSIAIAASNGVVTDPMGEHIDLHFSGEEPVVTNDLNVYTGGNGDIYISQGTVTYNKETDTVGWNVGSVNEGSDPIMKYRVRADENYKAKAGEVLDVNKKTTFSYKNHRQEQTVKEFPIPKVTVNGGTILVHWYRVNDKGEPVNKNGEKVESPSTAEQLDVPEYFDFEGSTGLKLNTEYILKPRDFSEKSYNYFRYILNDGSLSDGSEVKVTLTWSDSSQQVWFAYKKQENCSITVVKTGAQELDRNQSFIFYLSGMDQNTKDIELTLCIQGNGSATVENIPKGDYEITEDVNWSWRYTPEGDTQKTVSAAENTNTITFSNKRENDKWLNGNDYCENKFTTASGN